MQRGPIKLFITILLGIVTLVFLPFLFAIGCGGAIGYFVRKRVIVGILLGFLTGVIGGLSIIAGVILFSKQPLSLTIIEPALVMGILSAIGGGIGAFVRTTERPGG